MSGRVDAAARIRRRYLHARYLRPWARRWSSRRSRRSGEISPACSRTASEHEGYLESDEHVITWAVGHLVQLAEPDEYDPKYKKWRMADLPIVPDSFKLVVATSAEQADGVITELLKRDDVDAVVNACDAGREGELIFAWPVREGERAQAGRAAVALLDDHRGDQGGARRAAPADEFARLEEAARSRSEADWIVGMNATRAATIRLRSSFDGAVSLGRVQTPTLALVARREEEIRAFKPEPTGSSTRSSSRRGRAGALRGALPRGRQAAPADGRGRGDRRRRARPSGAITKLEKSTKKERAPLLYDLTSLQRDANTRSASPPGARSPPRSGSTRSTRRSPTRAQLALPDRRHGRGDQADRRAGRPATPSTPAAPYVHRLDTLPLGRVVNDAKVTDHHAIIPTRAEHRVEDERRRQPDLRPRRGASSRSSIPTRCSRTRASRRPSRSTCSARAAAC